MKPGSEQLKQQIAQEPDNAELYYQLGLALQEEFPGYTFLEKRGDGAVWNFKGMDEMDKAVELDPMNYKYVFTSAQFREKRGDTEFALRGFKRCAELNPNADGLFEEIVRVQNIINAQKEKQKNRAEESLAKKPQDVNAMHSMAMALGDAGKYDDAMQWYNKALETDPEQNENTWALIALLNHKCKRYEEAIAAYQKSADLFVPDEPDEEELNDPDYEPDTNANMYQAIAECYHELKNLDKAEEFYQKAYSLEPNWHGLKVHLADIEYDRKNYKAALAMFMEAAEKVDAKQYRYLDESLGLCYLQLNDLENAKKSLEKCIKKNKGYSRAYYNLGVVYDRMGDEEGVEMVLQMAVQANHRDIQSLFQLAKIYQRKGYMRDALELLEQALLCNPFEPVIMEMKAEIYAGMGDSERAEMEAGMAQFIKDMIAGKDFTVEDEDDDDDEYDEDDEDDGEGWKK